MFPASKPKTKILSFSPYLSFFESCESSMFPHVSSNRSLNPSGFSSLRPGALLRPTSSVSSLPLFFASSAGFEIWSWE